MPLVRPLEQADPTVARQALSRIADALGVPVVALHDPDLMPAEIASTAELVSLYLAIESEPAQAKVLAFARMTVAAQWDRVAAYPTE